MLKFETQGIRELTVKLDKLAKFDSLKMNVVGEMVRADILEHFRGETGPRGSWAPLKKRKGKILQDTGRLRGSIRAESTKRTAAVSTSVAYAGVHQFGSSEKNIPQRKFMWLSKQGLAKVLKFLTARFRL